MTRFATAVALAALAFAALGCGETVIDDVKTADTIQSYLEKSLNEKVKSVECPSDKPVDPGSKINCQVIVAGGEQKVATVEIINEDADFGFVGYKPKK